MSSSFFEWQRQARKHTYVLSLLLLVMIAVISFALTYCLLPFIYLFLRLAFWEAFGFVLIVVSVVILGGTYSRYSGLWKRGAHTIALKLGAKPLDYPRTLLEQRYLNVVEEASIAAGIPMPLIYLLETDRINVFATGKDIDSSLICVTRGCLTGLNREELQAVVSHEIGHIVHGDVLINMRAIGVVYGLSIISQFGLNVLAPVDEKGKRKVAHPYLVVPGVLIYVIGYLGGLASQVVQAWLCRTREYHADATSVQLTRQPDALASALKRLGTGTITAIPGNYTNEVRHLFFCEAASYFSERVFSTHPELSERIKKLEPYWDGEWLRVERKKDRLIKKGLEEESRRQEEEARTLPSEGVLSEDRLDSVGAAAFTLLQFKSEDIWDAYRSGGAPTNLHLRYARRLLHALPLPLSQMIHSVSDGFLIPLVLLLKPEEEIKLKQLQWLKSCYPTQVAKVLEASEALQRSNIQDKLTLFDLAVPSLRKLKKDDFESLISHLKPMIEADGRVSLFEWCLYAITKHLYRVLHLPTRFIEPVLEPSLSQYETELGAIFGALVKVSGMGRERREQVLEKASFQLGISLADALSESQMGGVEKALERCAELSSKQREKILNACLFIATYDDVIRVEESQALRAIATVLGCPMPPVVVEANL